MSQSTIPPPPMREDAPYEDWKKEIQVWQLITNLPDKKQGPAVLLSLQGKARNLCLEMDMTELTTDKGVEAILKKLDGMFLADIEQQAFDAYERFEQYARGPMVSLEDYLFEFDRRYERVKKHGMTLPEGVLAYRLLKSASLSESEEKLARATVESLTFKDMKATLKKITGQSSNGKSEGIVVKAEAFVNEAGRNAPVSSCSSLDSTLYTQTGRRNWNSRYRPNSGRYRQNGGQHQENGNAKQSETYAKKPNFNPKDRWGNVSRCAICDSKCHWVADCPHKQAAEEKSETIHVTLYTESEKAVTEDGHGIEILDSGCTSSVCGREWFDCYVASLDDSQRRTMKESSSNRSFKFGDGNVIRSMKEVVLPCVIGSNKVNIQCDVVESKIPLLLSKSAMKRANTKIDFADDKIHMFGEEMIPLKNSAGHYCITLGPNVKEINFTMSGRTLNDEQVANKLHRQFAHASSRQIVTLLKKAEKYHEPLELELTKVEQACDVCARFKKPRPRPSVGLPMATVFNEAVGIDLKFLDGVIVIHLVDLATRYCAAAIVKNKSPEKIIEAIFSKWISVFDCP